METKFTKNEGLGFTENQWGQLIEGNGLLIMWFIEWNLSLIHISEPTRPY